MTWQKRKNSTLVNAYESIVKENGPRKEQSQNKTNICLKQQIDEPFRNRGYFKTLSIFLATVSPWLVISSWISKILNSPMPKITSFFTYWAFWSGRGIHFQTHLSLTHLALHTQSHGSQLVARLILQADHSMAPASFLEAAVCYHSPQSPRVPPSTPHQSRNPAPPTSTPLTACLYTAGSDSTPTPPGFCCPLQHKEDAGTYNVY